MRHRTTFSRISMWMASAAILSVCAAGCSPPPAATPPSKSAAVTTVAPADSGPAVDEGGRTESTAEGLPRLLDLGAGKCIPCKMMAPILDEMKEQYAGKLQVDFIDVWKHPDAAKKYGVDSIPTQVFFDAKGKELFRHVGFYAKEDILAKWKALGVDLGTE